MTAELKPPADLTIPAPGSTTAREVLSLAMRRLLVELGRIAARRVSPRLRGDHARFTALLRTLGRTGRGALASLVRRPTIGVLLRCLRDAEARGLASEALLVELMATACLELAAAGALPEPITLELLPPRIVSLAARRVVERPDGARRARFLSGQVVFERAEGPVVASLQPDPARFLAIVEGGPVLALADNNPISDFEAHPDKQGNQLDLGGQPAAAWRASLADTLARIEAHMPELRAEIDLFIHQVIPVGYDERTHLSASYLEDIGTVYMTLHPNAMTMTEAVIHEFSHNKINALFELDAVLENAFHPLYRSPVRPDPRPLHGVLLAVHAFLPVARLYERMIEDGAPGSEHPDFRRRYAQIIGKNREGAAVLLEHARPTPIGAGVLEEIRRWDAHFASRSSI
ncbi:MAG: HEXXH motif-containing putative peptide modification protein [Nannocystaceae bacterium]|nr:hypothetical protein [Myxococcales bacterium]